MSLTELGALLLPSPTGGRGSVMREWLCAIDGLLSDPRGDEQQMLAERAREITAQIDGATTKSGCSWWDPADFSLFFLLYQRFVNDEFEVFDKMCNHKFIRRLGHVEARYLLPEKEPFVQHARFDHSDDDRIRSALLAWMKIAFSSSDALLAECNFQRVDSLFQFCIALCVAPNLARGVGVPLSDRLSDKRFMAAFAEFLPIALDTPDADRITEKQILWLDFFIDAVNPVVLCDDSESPLATHVRRRYLCDYFAALLQIINCVGAGSSSVYRGYLKAAMNTCSLRDLFAALLPLLRDKHRRNGHAAPRWLRADCTALLGRCLARQDGFSTLVQTENAARLCAACICSLYTHYPSILDSVIFDPLFAPLKSGRHEFARLDVSFALVAALSGAFPPGQAPAEFYKRLHAACPILLCVLSRPSVRQLKSAQQTITTCISEALSNLPKSPSSSTESESQLKVAWLVDFVADKSNKAPWMAVEVKMEEVQLWARFVGGDHILLCDEDLEVIQKEQIDVFLDVMTNSATSGPLDVLCRLLLAALQRHDTFNIPSSQVDQHGREIVCLAVIMAILDRLSGLELDGCSTSAVTSVATELLERSVFVSASGTEGGEMLELRQQCGAVAVALLSAQIALIREEDLTQSELCRIADLCESVVQSPAASAQTRDAAQMLQQLLKSLLGAHQVTPSTSKVAAGAERPSAFDLSDILSTLDDKNESPAMRGGALIQLARRLQSRPPPDDVIFKKFDEVLSAVSGSLCDPDSYVYLSAVRALCTMALLRTDIVLPLLVDSFLSQTDEHTVETRLTVGECIASLCRRLVAPVYARRLTGAFLQMVRHADEHARASAISNLAELAVVAPHSLLADVNEILYCLESNLGERAAAVCRRASLHLLRSLLEGAGVDMLQLLGSRAAELYRRCRYLARHDADAVVQMHAQLCLQQFDCNMSDALQPLVVEM